MEMPELTAPELDNREDIVQVEIWKMDFKVWMLTLPDPDTATSKMMQQLKPGKNMRA